MNTPTHMLTAAALLSKQSHPTRNNLILFGALLPDLFIFVLLVWSRLIDGVPHRQIWSKIYWQEPWQLIGAISNSVPLWLALALVAYMIGWRVLAALALAAIIHVALDFPVHASDAHRHFWPLSDWRYHAPLSYWDPNHHSRWVKLAELAIVLTCIVVLWRRFESRKTRAILVLAFLSLSLAPVFFWLTLATA